MDGDKLDRKIGIVSILSLSWQLGLQQMEQTQMMNSQLHCRLVYTDVFYSAHLSGNCMELGIPLGWEHLQGLGSAIAISVALGHVIFLSLVSRFRPD